MPLIDLAAEAVGGFVRATAAVLGSVLRVLAQCVAQLVVELLIEGALQTTGRLLLRTLAPRYRAGDTACTVAGLLCWLAVGALAWALHARA
jgi:hypothetical protein